MTIETVIDWAKGDPVGAVMLPICALAVLGVLVFWTRCVWRWVAGRRKKREVSPAPELAPAECDPLRPETFVGCWFEFIPEPGSRYTFDSYDTHKGSFKFVNPKNPADIVTALYSFVWMKMRVLGRDSRYTIRHWRGDLNLVVRSEEPKPAPDLKYQGDQVTGMRKELLALEERVGRMEAAHYSLDWIVAQQMRDPHFEPVGTQPVEGDIVFNPDKKRYSIVESVSDEVYLDDGGSYHCWAFMSPAVVPDDRFGGEQRPRVLRRNPQ